MVFGFREPYQILVDADMIQDTERFKMDIVGALERTLNGKVKPMITQCSIRHLYTLKDLPQPQKDVLISIAKNMERRRCGHHTLDEPLSTLECVSSVIDPKKSLTNKNRYVVASQDEEVRRFCRDVRGVPLVYVKRSVMVMEPMAQGSVGVRDGIERSKFRSGLRGKGSLLLGKRKRGEDEGSDVNVTEGKQANSGAGSDEKAAIKKKIKGPKGPNPLSVKKPRREASSYPKTENEDGETALSLDRGAVHLIEGALDEAPNPPAKRKRKRKHKSQ